MCNTKLHIIFYTSKIFAHFFCADNEWFGKHFKKKLLKNLRKTKKCSTFALGEMAEWSIAAVLKTVELRGSGGSNPSLSAKEQKNIRSAIALLYFFTLIEIVRVIRATPQNHSKTPLFR